MNDTDLCLETHTNASRWVRLRLIHLPTGTTVEGETDGSRHNLYTRLRADLQAQVEKEETL